MNDVVNEGLNFEEENSSNNFSALLFKKQEENSVKTGRNLMGDGVRSNESKPVETGRGRIISNDAEMSMLTPKVCYYGTQDKEPPLTNSQIHVYFNLGSLRVP